ncbi:hypothetical protein P3T76_008304 [Phytophthora citrophthora]|uniref:Uncharacterized protein n=1 Tax=Phytophthora citrophthora TaxID=4793 RepID=A0AAD9LKU5_9STRA|nr:hypothetical protein P3T76_008304 [Phytophthora citrophthora]
MLRQQYLSPRWKFWHYCASQSPGVTTNQYATESHNRGIKRVVSGELYASTMVVTGTKLPRIIAHFGTAREEPPTISGRLLLHQSTLNVHVKLVFYLAQVVQDSLRIGMANTVMIGSNSMNPVPVNDDRADMYLQSRKGHLQRDDTVANIE